MGHTPRELLIMRHAKSDWGTAAARDFDRPLNGRGARDAPRVGRWLRHRAWIPDHLVSSPAQRARSTVLAVVDQLGLEPEQVQWDQRIYLAGVPDLLAVLADCPSRARRVLLVGHNPGLEELVCRLARPADLPSPPYGFFKTAALARLRLAKGWQELDPGTAELLQLVTPKTLPPE